MTFPYDMEAASHFRKDEGEEPEHLAHKTLNPPAVIVRWCEGCDGSGLWRGIDGLVFVCPHCCFEMP